ncbi:hypothetical protein FRC08_014244 [Ceratobasidium sp. 394]|nr:hypothetical protein FRC08_014244 [Ceratobasidium sp. 394]
MVDFDLFNLNDAYDYIDNNNLDAEWDLEPEPKLLPNPAESQAPTDDDAEFEAVLMVVRCLNENSLKIDQFLDVLCWGNKKCVGNLVLKEAQRQLVQSKRLPSILNHMHTPINYTGKCPKAAAATLNHWAWRHVTQLACHKLNEMAKDTHINRADDNTLNFPDHDYIKFNVLKDRTRLLTPGLVRFLTLTSQTKPRVRAQLNQEDLDFLEVDPPFAVVLHVYSLAYRYAPRFNRLQKHLILYFLAKHVLKSLYSLFNKCGYTLSYAWANNTIAALSAEALVRMKDAVKNHAMFWIHDNHWLATPIKAQHGDRHTVTDNGTTMTVVELPDTVKHIFLKDIPADAEGDHPPPDPPASTPPTNLSLDDFLDFELFGRLVNYKVYLIHTILFETVPRLADLEVCSDDKLCPPVLLHTMPWGEEHKTRYHMLGTVPIDESSVGGNLQVMNEIVRQTGLN